MWSVGSGGSDATFTDAQDWVYVVRFSPDSKRLAAGTWDGTILVWSVADKKLEGKVSTKRTRTTTGQGAAR
jgi:WD40 repeat protein